MEERANGRRLDYLAKVTGRAAYLADMKLPGLCHGRILRSPYPHARIVRIDASKARQIPGVVATLTRDDIIDHPALDPYYGPVFKDQTIVAVEKVRHVGDPVAAVAALNTDAAEEALGAIDVEYEELPAITDVHEALKKNATLVHNYVKVPEAGFGDFDIIVHERRVSLERLVHVGDRRQLFVFDIDRDERFFRGIRI